jgi:hypothetical protein
MSVEKLNSRTTSPSKQETIQYMKKIIPITFPNTNHLFTTTNEVKNNTINSQGQIKRPATWAAALGAHL